MDEKNKQTAALFRAYKQALSEEQQTKNAEEKIRVFSRVTDFCRTMQSCNKVSEEVRNIVLFWSYAKLGDIAYDIPGDDERAALFYKNALHFAPGNAERIAVGKKIAAIYLRTRDDENLQEILKMILRFRENAEDIKKFVKLAEKQQNPVQKHHYLEQAWKMAKCDSGGEARRCREIYDMLDNVPATPGVRAIAGAAGQSSVLPPQS